MKSSRSVPSPGSPSTKSPTSGSQKSLDLLEKNRKAFEKIFNQKIEVYDKTQGNLIVYPLDIDLGTIRVGEQVSTLFAVYVGDSEDEEKKENIRIQLPEDCFMKTTIKTVGYINHVTLDIVPERAGPLKAVLHIYTDKYSYNLPLTANVQESSGLKPSMSSQELTLMQSPATASPNNGTKKLSEFATPVLLDADKEGSGRRKKNEYTEKEPFQYGKRHRTVMFMWD